MTTPRGPLREKSKSTLSQRDRFTFTSHFHRFICLSASEITGHFGALPTSTQIAGSPGCFSSVALRRLIRIQRCIFLDIFNTNGGKNSLNVCLRSIPYSLFTSARVVVAFFFRVRQCQTLRAIKAKYNNLNNFLRWLGYGLSASIQPYRLRQTRYRQTKEPYS